MGVRTPVESMSTRVLIGIVQAFVQPGNCIFLFISAMSSSHVITRSSGQSGWKTDFIQRGAQREYQRSSCTFRHAAAGFRRTVVSTIVSGAGSVAESDF